MNFPEESIARAREIAGLYRQRKKDQFGRALLLYDNAFLELHYGYEDAIKQGKLGLYLHEMQEKAECFSLAGAHYLIAKEAGLQPKIYWALDMKDVLEGENPLKGKVDHAFITVMINGKEFLLDRHYNAFGKIFKHENGSLFYALDNDRKKNGLVERSYSSLKELSENDFLELMEKIRAPGGAIHTLVNGQKLKTNKGDVLISYSPKENIFTAFTWQDVFADFLDSDDLAKNFVLELNTPVAKNGRLSIEDSVVRGFYVRGVGWKKDQHQNPHEIVTFPLRNVKQYIEHLEIAARFFGRKTSLLRSSIVSKELYFQERGFDWTGRIIKPNGVDPRVHHQLLESLAENARNIQTSPEQMQKLKRGMLYKYLRQKKKSADNKRGFLYTRKEHEEFIREQLEELRSFYHVQVHRLMEAEYADAGLSQTSMKRAEQEIRKHVGKDSTAKILARHLPLRVHSPEIFYYMIDRTLFKRDNPLDSISEPTEELMKSFHSAYMHSHIIHSFKQFNLLELRGYRKGLERILANTAVE